MIRLKLDRDQTRTLQTWFDYWHIVCNSKIAHPDNVENAKQLWKIFNCILQQIEKKIASKLNGKANRFNFSFTSAEAIVLEEFCKKTPIDASKFYLINLRQYVIDHLDIQIL
jgi:hypothetical protein